MAGPQDDGKGISQTHRSTHRASLFQRPILSPASVEAEMPVGDELVGRGLEAVRDVLRELVRTPLNFLLIGKTGGGKDQFARVFHQASSRSGKPFHAVNCAAIPESLFESQLFGYRKGAFTGADGDRPGILEAAEGGFVLLNEITDVPLPIQAKLLQAIEEKIIWRVGDPKPRRIDVWIAAATNRTDLAELCDRGLFRGDLYHRLAQVVVHIPPLCERSEDIPDLLKHLVGKVADALGRHPIRFSPEAVKVLRGYSWPGNVRELQNLIRSLTLMNEGSSIGVDNLPESVRQKPSDPRRARITRDQLRRTLVEEEWNVSRAAARIGFSREHVHALSRRYGLARPAKSRSESTALKRSAKAV